MAVVSGPAAGDRPRSADGRRENLRPDRAWLYTLIASGCTVVSIGIDTVSGPSRRLVLVEELAEMIAATSVRVAALTGFVVDRAEGETGAATSRRPAS